MARSALLTANMEIFFISNFKRRNCLCAERSQPKGSKTEVQKGSPAISILSHFLTPTIALSRLQNLWAGPRYLILSCAYTPAELINAWISESRLASTTCVLGLGMPASGGGDICSASAMGLDHSICPYPQHRLLSQHLTAVRKPITAVAT